MTRKHVFSYFVRNLNIVIGLVLIWRGIWYLLDEIDKVVLGGSHILTTIGGIVLGLIILYIPDKNLDEISKL